jgi:hypothetical protein
MEQEGPTTYHRLSGTRNYTIKAIKHMKYLMLFSVMFLWITIPVGRSTFDPSDIVGQQVWIAAILAAIFVINLGVFIRTFNQVMACAEVETELIVDDLFAQRHGTPQALYDYASDPRFLQDAPTS